MREIKFKAWHKKEKRWLKLDVIDFVNKKVLETFVDKDSKEYKFEDIEFFDIIKLESIQGNLELLKK